MSCRTTRAGSAFTTYARLSGSQEGRHISDASTLSLFHQLRREYAEGGEGLWGRSTITQENYLSNINMLYREVTSDPNISEARRQSIIERLEQARAENIDEATMWALRNINRSATRIGINQASFISEYAEALNIPLDEARARFLELENSIDRRRDARDPETYTQANIEKARDNGLSVEAGAVHAQTIMREEIIATENARNASRPPRVERIPLNGEVSAEDAMRYTGQRVVEAGYDIRNGHTEVVTENAAGERSTHYYRNISPSIWERMQGDPTGTWERYLNGSTWNEYRNETERVRASYAPNCPICGQFASTSHSCPPTRVPQVQSYSMRSSGVRTSGQPFQHQFVNEEGETVSAQLRIDLPLVADFRAAAANGGIILNNVDTYVGSYWSRNTTATIGYGHIQGDVGVFTDPETNQLTINVSQLKCECEAYKANYDCEHVRAYANAIRRRLTPPERVPAAALTPEQRAERLAAAQARAEAAAASDWTRAEETLADAKRLWQENTETLYSNDFETFETHYREAEEAMVNKNGAPVIPFMKENALGGMATRESGQGFGMEIEYEFADGVDRAEANRKIGEALYEAKIFSTPEQQGYHAAGRNGYKDTHIDPETGQGTWSFEHDGSVSGGEIVTPLMYDEPETWANLEKVVKILKENGAIATTRAGAHVHVGTGFYQGDVTKYGELAKMMNQHEDVMFRLAQNPERKTHRQTNYTAPLREAPAGGWRDLSDLRRWQSGRTKILNFTSVGNSDTNKDHPEFRIFDSTLDAGAMQSQIKLAVAMTHAAARVASDQPTIRKKEEIGAHAERNKGRRSNARMTSEKLKDESATFRSFMDTLFTRVEDKKQLTSLFAATKWNKASAANRRMQRNGY